MKVAPWVEVILAGLPNKDHQINAIPGTPARPALDELIDKLRVNAASITTLNGGGHFGHTALTMSPVEYATIPRNAPFLMETAPLEN